MSMSATRTTCSLKDSEVFVSELLTAGNHGSLARVDSCRLKQQRLAIAVSSLLLSRFRVLRWEKGPGSMAQKRKIEENKGP
eukprot:4828512-Amphidinium_carterae.1